MVTREALVRNKAQLRNNFRYIPKSGEFSVGSNEVRRLHSCWGRRTTSHALHVFAVRDRFVANEFPEVTS